MTTLTDRYVYAALRSIPEQQRADIDRELRTSIDDAVDARVDSGLPPQDAEFAVLSEFGDPARLAASYADRPLQLIGPALFLDWWRLLKLLLAVVLPIATAGVILGQILAGRPPGAIAATAVTALISLTVQLTFWTTLVFAILERTTGRKGLRDWTPSMLPQLPAPGRIGFGDVVATIVFVLIFGGLIVWQQFSSVVTDSAGNPVPLLNPDLWSFWLPYFLVLLVLEVAFSLLVWRTGRWTYPLAALNVATSLLFAVPALWLLFTGQLFNPAFFEELGLSALVEPGSATFTIAGFFLVLIPVWDIVDGFLKARSGARLLPAAALH
jgi:hypothetical protein